MTAKYLLKRGHIFSSGYSNCPYGYAKKVDPTEPPELSLERGASEPSDPFSDGAIQLKLDLYSDRAKLTQAFAARQFFYRGLSF